jgi:phosphatidylglycerophosphate synthase
MPAADALSAMRLVLAAAMPFVLMRGGILPLVAWGLAALSDYVDGPLARRTGTTSLRGALLDTVADVTFVLGGLGTAAALGLVSWVVPASIGLSAGAYAAASARPHPGGRRLARSRLGHAAGVLNYACLGLVTGAVAWPAAPWSPWLAGAGAVTAATNLAALASRLGGAPRSPSQSL